MVRENVRRGAKIYTDELLSYDGLSADYVHNVINHAEAYVDGQIHTNGCENFWSLLKRAIKGTYVSVEPFHLFAIWTSKRSALIRASCRTLLDSLLPPLPSLVSGSHSPN
jgi:ISXO2-like transposase domain